MTVCKIRVLDDHTINKIAAGEVIADPASVVKELVENSLDAQATSLSVEIQEGGRELIRVSDNGCGMAKDDAILCLERHATSKIREVEDIQEIMTMGFRGEAIPSIAAISKLTLLTSPVITDKKEEGTLIRVDGGRMLSCASAIRTPGTTMEVKSLFFNVPVRRKFQKSPHFDTQEILKTISLLALAYPQVEFELISNAKLLLKAPSSDPKLAFHQQLSQRLEHVFGKEYMTSLLPVEDERGSFKLEGFISSPTTHKPNRTGQHLFINQRYVFSSLVASAIREGYQTMLPTGRYPLFVLHLRLPGSHLDVNVHPQKKEVRLRQEQDIKKMLIDATQKALRQEQGKTVSSLMPFNVESSDSSFFDHEALDRTMPQTPSPLPPFWKPYASLLPSPSAASSSTETWEFRSVPLAAPLQERSIESSPEPLSGTLFNQVDLLPFIPRVLATILGYCLIDPFRLESKLFGVATHKCEGGLAIVDQRAAYTRIHYEALLKQSIHQEVQSLLIPLTLSFMPAEADVLHEHLEILHGMGFGLREFGNSTFVVDALPSFLQEDQLQTFFNLLIQDLVEMSGTRRMQAKKEEQVALIACRASLPKAKRLSLEEAQGLVQQLIQCELAAQCPLGKPTCLYLAPEEIGKWFQKHNT